MTDNNLLMGKRILIKEIRFSGKNFRSTDRYSESAGIQFDQVADIHLQHFQTGQYALGVSV